MLSHGTAAKASFASQLDKRSQSFQRPCDDFALIFDALDDFRGGARVQPNYHIWIYSLQVKNSGSDRVCLTLRFTGCFSRSLIFASIASTSLALASVTSALIRSASSICGCMSSRACFRRAAKSTVQEYRLSAFAVPRCGRSRA
jgi:hypothetical protein